MEGKGERDRIGDPGGKQYSKCPLSCPLSALEFPSACLGHALTAQHAKDHHSILREDTTPRPLESDGFPGKSLVLLSRRVDGTPKGSRWLCNGKGMELEPWERTDQEEGLEGDRRREGEV